MTAPEPTDTGLIDIGGGGMFRSLGVYNFRVWFLGSLASSVGSWMGATAMSWIVPTELTDGDVAAMGLTVMLQAGPSLLLIPLVGKLVDRFDRRTMLFVTSAFFSVFSLVIGTLLVLGLVELHHMFLYSALWGVLMAFDQPLRQSFF